MGEEVCMNWTRELALCKEKRFYGVEFVKLYDGTEE